MLRPLDDLVRFLRRHSPGRREQLAFRLLHSIVVEPAPRPVPVRREILRAGRAPDLYEPRTTR